MTSTTNFTPSSAPLKTIREIQFGLLSPEELKAQSVVKVIYPETLDEARQRPRDGGLSDPRLGTIDKGVRCATCSEGPDDCPGHFGHIELAAPVWHPGFLVKCKKLLEMVCHSCGKLLIDESTRGYDEALRQRDPKKRFDKFHKLAKPKMICEMDSQDEDDPKEASKKVSHGGCGNSQPEIRKEGLKLVGTWKIKKSDEEDDVRRQPEKRTLTPRMALDVFKMVSNEDARKVGLSNDWARPEWLIIQVMPVPPPQVRPSVVVSGTGHGPRGEDDLTYKLGDIIRANGNVEGCEAAGSPQHIRTELETLLQFHVATFMDNNLSGQPQAMQKSGRPVKSIRARMKGKEGRLRGNLMGKRVDFSARTVITGDPNLSLDEVGVPISIARTLTYPERVTPLNIHKLSLLVRNGPNLHPGAKYVYRDDGHRWDLKLTKNPPNLQYGWIVERHIDDGDFVIFNRQPSLHKESMMGHRVRVMAYSTFRLNLSVTSPYNADFDGDEMNLHVPQGEETRAEIASLCMVPYQIVSPQKNGPLMGIVQDTLCGIYKICRRDVFLTHDQVMNILLWVPEWDGIMPTPAILKPKPMWTGKQIISMALPEGLNLVRGSGEGMSPLKDEGLFVKNGELMFGLFNKKVVGAAAGGVIHIVYNEKGPEAAVNFFDEAQRIVNHWLLHNGFSIGIGDTIPDATTIEQIQNHVSKRKAEVEEITQEATSDQLQANPGMTLRETFESKVSKALNAARDDAGTSTEKSLKDLNNAAQMSRAGSKGSSINISQMTAIVGQQIVEGKRIPFGFKYRTLPHFTKDDYSPASRGFVENSYLRGLTPPEFFFHAMAGREGLIDTAVKTAETGYIQRRLVKALEDVSCKYDGTIRNSLGDVVQFLYGEDGIDAVYIEQQRMETITCSDKEFEDMFKVDVANDPEPLKDCLDASAEIAGNYAIQQLLEEEWDQLVYDRQRLRDNRKYRANKDDDWDALQLPLNVKRMIDTAKTTFRIKDGARSDIHPEYAILALRNLLNRMQVVRGDDELSLEADESATLLFKAQLRAQLAFKRVVKEHSLNKLAFDNILGDIEGRFALALVSPGEMVGVLAAQSIGEPATQMTLNTFHFAGVSSKNVTLGVPRLKEILNVAKDIKTPSMTVYQKPENVNSKESCKVLRSSVEHTTLRTVSNATEIYYDPDIKSTIIPEDADMVDAYFIIPDEDMENAEVQSKWLLRIVLDRSQLLDKNLGVQDVAHAIKTVYGDDFFVIFSDENAQAPVIRIRINMSSYKATGEEGEGSEDETGPFQELLQHMLNNLTLKGVPGVEKAFVDEMKTPRFTPDGRIIEKKDDPLCKEYVLQTSGIALQKLLENPDVDPHRTYCNSFIEIFQVLGVEATRNALMRELVQVLSFDGSYVNHRHLALLCDIMTSRGHLMAVTRHGINRADTGVLMRSSFEETVEILLEAAAVGELDDCRGVSENIVLGQQAPAGTGEMEVLLDQELLDSSNVDNAAQGLLAGYRARRPTEDGAATPYEIGSPLAEDGLASPAYGGAFSPLARHGGEFSSGDGFTPYNTDSARDGGFSPWAGGTSPYAPTSPFSGGASPSSPGGFTPSSPAGYSPSSPSMDFGAASPRFSATSPTFGSPASPAMATPTSPMYSPTSPSHNISPSSPRYSPTSPSYSPTSPSYSPTSPSYSPTSPATGARSDMYSPASPAYSPTSPKYSPTSPKYSPTSPRQQSPTSPKYSPTSPQGAYSPTSPRIGSPTSPGGPGTAPYSAASPQWTPTSPTYSPTSPQS